MTLAHLYNDLIKLRVQEEASDDASVLTEFTEGMESLGEQIADYLQDRRKTYYAIARDNIGMFV